MLPLFQVNGVRNSLDRILDLVLLDNASDHVIHRSDNPILPEDVYHPSLEFTSEICGDANPSISNLQFSFEFNFKSANYTLLNLKISEINWIQLFDGLPVDLALETFYSLILEFMEECIPKRRALSLPNNNEHWITPDLKKLKNKKNRLHKKLKKNFTVECHQEFSNLRKELMLKSLAAYELYLNKVKRGLKDNPNSFWNFVRQKKSSNSYPLFLEFEDQSSSCDKGMCDIFANFFASVYDVNLHPAVSTCDTSNETVIFTPYLNVYEIRKAASNLKELVSSGPDNIPSCVIKRCATSLSTPLCYLFNLSLNSSVFPKLWKKSFIVPLYKNGNRTHASNYRGIAKLSTIPKLFESLLITHLFHNLKSKLTPAQHGFFKERSISSNLIELTSKITEGFSKKQQTDVGYFDFSKAFDRINHKILLDKMERIGFESKYVLWAQSYLTERQQQVKFKNQTSRKIDVTSGVPQGSHLGPLLFLVYINDLPDALNYCDVLLYADDVKIFHSYSSYTDCWKIQHDFDRLVDWSGLNCLSLNIKKCKIMSFSRKPSFIVNNYMLNGQDMERCDKFNDLGVLFDKKLTFIPHIDIIVSKASSRLGLIKRWAKELNDPYVTKSLYVGLVRSVLEFACQVWNPFYSTHIKRIESVQKQFLLFALKSLNWNDNLRLPPYKHRLLLLDMNTLEDRRKALSCIFVFKVLTSKISSPFLLESVKFVCPQRNLRIYVPIKETFFNVNYLIYEPYQQCLKCYNNLYQFIDYNLSEKTIKNNVFSYFKRNL
jgi:hypothetical protein